MSGIKVAGFLLTELYCSYLRYSASFNSYSAGIDLSRQILTTKVDPRTVRVKIFLMAVDP